MFISSYLFAYKSIEVYLCLYIVTNKNNKLVTAQLFEKKSYLHPYILTLTKIIELAQLDVHLDFIHYFNHYLAVNKLIIDKTRNILFNS